MPDLSADDDPRLRTARHELRNTLQFLTTAVECLQHTKRGADAVEALDIMIRTADQALVSIDDLTPFLRD